MRTSEALRLTKSKLWDGKGNQPAGMSGFGCFAAYHANVGYIVTPILAGLLAPYSSLGQWLSNVKGIDPQGQTKKLQATRHAWLEHLIAHYESLGD